MSPSFFLCHGEALLTLASSWGVKDPALNLTLSGWSFLTSLGWSATARAVVPDRINQLLNLSDVQLRALTKIEALVRQHTAMVSQLEARLPDCDIDLSGTWQQRVVVPEDGAYCLVSFPIVKTGINSYVAEAGTKIEGNNCGATIADEPMPFTVTGRTAHFPDGVLGQILDKNTIQIVGDATATVRRISSH